VLLKINDINVFYGSIHVLKDVSIEIKENEIVALVGANGAGKTTTLNTISGILQPRTGEIYFLNERIDQIPPEKIVQMGISHIPENRELFPYMTVLENLELGAIFLPYAKGHVKENLEWVFELFPKLKERIKQLAGTLSGGEQQMLAIGRALMSKPKLLMFDEPSLGLAPKITVELFETIVNINKQNTTILLVEQNVRRSLKIAHHVYVLETGKIAIKGEAKDLINNSHVKEAYLGL